MCMHGVAQAKAYGGEESGTCYFSLVRSQLMQKAKRPWSPDLWKVLLEIPQDISGITGAEIRTDQGKGSG